MSSESPARDDAIAEALQAHTKALMQTMQTMQTIAERQKDKKVLSSTIRVNPTVQWPKLSDDGPDCREVEAFFESFDDTCGLANDGAGMADKERLKVLLSCLKGSREKTYKVLHKKHRTLGDVDADPGKVFDIIKARLMRFVESNIEKQMRVLSEWEGLTKGKLSALQFEPQWEESLAELEAIGLARNERELCLNYLTKIGPTLASEVQRDMRAWPDGKGGLVSRRVSTWEECHEVCLELESLKQGSKALVSFPNAYCPNKGKGRGGNASAQGGGDGDEDKPAGIPAREAGQKNICYEFRDSGKCKFGDECMYSHDKAELAQSRKAEKAINAQKAEQKAEQSAGAVNTQTKGKGKDKGASAPE